MKFFNKIKKNSGFALLYAVMISSIILAMTLGVMNISLKEIKFSTEAKDTNEAFFNADIGAECALYYDIKNINFFSNPESGNIPTGEESIIKCANLSITYPNYNQINSNSWFYDDFTISGLGNSGQGCAIVKIEKTDSPEITTKITSKGYNNCVSNTNIIERELELNY